MQDATITKAIEGKYIELWTTWTSVAGAVGQLSKRGPWDMVELRSWRGRQACRIGPFERD